MENNEDIKQGKNLLMGVDFAEGEDKTVTDFLNVNCPKCHEEIKFKLAIGDIRNVEEYIENLLSRLKTAERMNDVLAEEMALHGICSGVEESDKCYANEIQCGKCIKEWARKKVEDE